MKSSKWWIEYGAGRIAYRMTVALSPAEKSQDIGGVQVGSGVLIRKAKRTFVATSSHYLDIVPIAEMTILFPPQLIGDARDMQAIRKALAANPNWKNPETRVRPINSLGVRRGSKYEDIALIEIAPHSIPKYCDLYDVTALKGNLTMPSGGEQVLVVGWPGMLRILERTKNPNPKSTEPSIDVSRACMSHRFKVMTVSDPGQWKDEDDRPSFKSFHFAVEYDRSKLHEDTDPHGLSGCGVWRETSETRGGIEIPTPVLIGIENNYHEARRALKVTRISRVLGLL